MATGAGSDLISIRKETKERLVRLKGDASFDAVLRALLDAASLEEVERRLVRPAEHVSEARPRSPEKQILIANLAAQRWQQWRASRRVVERGPRLFAWWPAEEPVRSVTYDWPERRGFSP